VLSAIGDPHHAFWIQFCDGSGLQIATLFRVSRLRSKCQDCLRKKDSDETRGIEGGANGQGGIRTHDTLAGIPVFETDAFSHSATCPDSGPKDKARMVKSEREARWLGRSNQLTQ
jgi:hypothetical protein